VDYARDLLANGADKIVVNTHAFNYPEFIGDLAKRFGTQSIIVSIDSKIGVYEKEFVAIDRGSKITDTETLEWAQKAESLGGGEIFINSVDFDGNRKGYNLKLIKSLAEALSIPVIAMGGVLKWEHLAEGIVQANAAAVAAANIFHYTEHSTKKAKKYLLESGLKFRKI
jgi:cyclase